MLQLQRLCQACLIIKKEEKWQLRLFLVAEKKKIFPFSSNLAKVESNAIAKQSKNQSRVKNKLSTVICGEIWPVSKPTCDWSITGRLTRG